MLTIIGYILVSLATIYIIISVFRSFLKKPQGEGNTNVPKKFVVIEFVQSKGFDKLYRASVLFICLGILVWILKRWIDKPISLDGATLVISAIILLMKDIQNFDWGSSAGSKEKGDTIKEMQAKPPTSIQQADNITNTTATNP